MLTPAPTLKGMLILAPTIEVTILKQESYNHMPPVFWMTPTELVTMSLTELEPLLVEDIMSHTELLQTHILLKLVAQNIKALELDLKILTIRAQQLEWLELEIAIMQLHLDLQTMDIMQLHLDLHTTDLMQLPLHLDLHTTDLMQLPLELFQTDIIKLHLDLQTKYIMNLLLELERAFMLEQEFQNHFLSTVILVIISTLVLLPELLNNSIMHHQEVPESSLQDTLLIAQAQPGEQWSSTEALSEHTCIEE